MAKSRTEKSIKNSLVALLFYFVGLVLQFISRKFFLEYLGTEVLGLNTTASNLLQFLNLAELGVGTAVSFTLYKPLFNKDTNAINEIISLQGWMYRRIAFVVIACAVVTMFFFPYIFSKIQLPLWYAYASFSVLMVSALLGYFVNYKQILLVADQKDYKVQSSLQTTKILKVTIQILALVYFHNPYIWWLVLEFIFTILSSIILEIVTNRTYPYLNPNLKNGALLYKKYPEIGVKIKQVFVHRIAYVALTQLSPIIIYAYTSLTNVAMYGNYMLIITGVTYLMNAIFNSMGAGIGNLVAEGHKSRIISVFKELFSFRFIFVATFSFAVYTLTPDFIGLWIGREYIMDNNILVIMVAILYIQLSRSTVDAFISAYGLFDDIWAPAAEAIINITCSIVFGYFWGLPGILLGVFLSLVIVVFLWKPIWLFKKGFKEKIAIYILMYIKYLLIGSLLWLLCTIIYRYLKIDVTSFGDFVINSIYSAGIFFILITLIIFSVDQSVRNRIKSIINKINKQSFHI